MNLYRNEDGTWVGTKAEAEKGANKVEVPINPKSALIAFLNGLNAERRPEAVSEANTVTTPTDGAAEAADEAAFVKAAARATMERVSLDEQVAAAPLRRRLGWAVEAIDAAEEMIGKMSAALRSRA